MDAVARVFRERIARIDQLLEYFEHHADPGAGTRARELTALLLDVNADAIERMLDIAGDCRESAVPMIERLLSDELVRGLLLLHGLHPLDVETRVRQALAQVRPYMVSHGGDIGFSGIDPDGVLRVILQGNCDGCPASQQTITSRIEDAVFSAAPEITAIRVEAAAPASRPLPEPATGAQTAPHRAGSGQSGREAEER